MERASISDCYNSFQTLLRKLKHLRDVISADDSMPLDQLQWLVGIELALEYVQALFGIAETTLKMHLFSCFNNQERMRLCDLIVQFTAMVTVHHISRLQLIEQIDNINSSDIDWSALTAIFLRLIAMNTITTVSYQNFISRI